MCTLTWLPSASGYDLVFSRDERRTRALAESLEVERDEDRDVAFARDPEGQGTWLAASDRGECVCVMNLYSSRQEGPRPGGAPRSRGVIPLLMMRALRTADPWQGLARLQLGEYSPFRLCVFGLEAPPLVWEWCDGRLTQRLAEGLLTTSSIRGTVASAYRHQAFQRFVRARREQPSGEELLAFHRQRDAQPELAVAMRRRESQTVSITWVRVADGTVSLKYFPGHPHDVVEAAASSVRFDGRARGPSRVVAPLRTFDLDAMTHGVPWLRGPLKRPALGAMRWVVRELEVNARLRALGALTPREFPERALTSLRVGIEATGALRAMPSAPPIYVANHPMGGLDGLALLAWVLSRHGKVVAPVSSLLSRLGFLAPYIVPLDRGRPTRQLASSMRGIFDRGEPVLIFPAGATARRSGGDLLDQPWRATAVRMAERYARPIVPVFVTGQNSQLFYAVAGLRKALRLVTNLEMLLLPRELVRPAVRQVTLRVGEPISAQECKAGGRSVDERILAIRQACYLLRDQP